MKYGNETLYRLFVLVADEKSITRASEKLYISQPAVSKQIKKLENELNTTLFNRKNMELTKNGKKLYNQLKPITDELERIEKSFEAKRNIKLGTYNTLMSKLLSSSILEFYKTYKDNDVIIENSNIEKMFQKLENGEVLTLGDGKVHLFNIFKKNGVYYTLSPYNQFASCHDAIISWGRNGIGLYYLYPISLENMYVAECLNKTSIDRNKVADSLNANNYSMLPNQRNPFAEINDIAEAMYWNNQAFNAGQLDPTNYSETINQLICRMEGVKRANQNNDYIINLADQKMDQALSGLNPNQ